MKLDPDEIKDYEQRRFFEKEAPSSLSGSTIFFAVLGAILVAWVLREAYTRWEIEQALVAFNQQIAVINAHTQEQLRRSQLQAEAMRAAATERARMQEEVNAQLGAEKIQQENDKRVQAVANAQEAARKEKAWEAYYKPIVGCEAENPNRETIKCGNDYIKAKRKFESDWLSKNNN